MPRQTYVTSRDKAAEIRIGRSLGEHLGLTWRPTKDPKSFVDGFLFAGSGEPAGVVECKARGYSRDAFPTYMIAERKISSALNFAVAQEIPFYLAVMWQDGAGFIEIQSLEYERRPGGRKDRKDAADQEMCLFIPIAEFKDLELIEVEAPVDMNDRYRKIMKQLRRAKTRAQVDKIARDNGKFVMELDELATGYTMAIHIRNAAEYARQCIRKGWR